MEPQMAQREKSKLQLNRNNLSQAKVLWPTQCSKPMLKVLRELTTRFGFSVALGEIRIIEGHWYVTHSGLLRLANRRLCRSIRVEPVPEFSDPNISRWVFKSTIQKSRRSRDFVGFGDADPSNVSPLMHGAEMRIAETRAVNRALRKAYGIGLCSVEELGWSVKAADTTQPTQAKSLNARNNGHNCGQPRLRDQLCLLIRQYNLDPNLVKAYAAHFCGTETLKEASRDLVESFISHLTASAKEDLDGLICRLNSFAPVAEVHQ
jgi:hypothetical protein